MSSRRMIDPAFWQSETVATLPITIRYFFIGLFSNADDQGRMKAHPALIRSKLYPYDDIALDDIMDWLNRLAAGEFVTLYSQDGKEYAQITNWWKYQHPRWAWPSDYPAPAGWQDRVHYRQGNTVVIQNWDHTETVKADESEDSGTTVEPEWNQNGTTVEPAPSGSNSGSGSGSISISGSTSNMDGASAPEAAVVAVLLAFGMSDPERVAEEAKAYSLPEVQDLIAHAEQHKLGPGWVRKQIRAGRRAPPAKREPSIVDRLKAQAAAGLVQI